MRERSGLQVRGYLIAIGSVALATAIWLCLTLLIGNRVFSSFILVAIAVTGRFADTGASCFALAIGAVLHAAYMQYIRLGDDVAAFSTIIVVYFVLGTILIALTHSERAARRRVEQHAAELESERDLLRHVIEVQEQDKKMICYEIHDGMVQDTAGALMLLEGQRNSHASTDGRVAFDQALGGLRRAVDEGRRIIQGVRPVVLDDLGIVAAIKELVHQAAAFGVEVQFDWDKSVERLPKSLETAVYRVAQEALTNAKKHSGSNTARIELRREGSQVVLRVEDSGRGFDLQAPRGAGFGLLGMTERVRLLGGHCSIQSRPGTGTKVVARFPIPKE